MLPGVTFDLQMKPTPRYLVFILVGCLHLPAADGRVQPARVCEVLENLTAYTGAPVAIVGRFSFRDGRRFLSEQGCEPKENTTPAAFRVTFSATDGPKPPPVFEIESDMVYRKLRLIQKHTSLGKFPFGTPNFDRWAVVYGRVLAIKPGSIPENGEFPATTAELVCRGEAVIMFLQ